MRKVDYETFERDLVARYVNEPIPVKLKDDPVIAMQRRLPAARLHAVMATFLLSEMEGQASIQDVLEALAAIVATGVINVANRSSLPEPEAGSDNLVKAAVVMGFHDKMSHALLRTLAVEIGDADPDLGVNKLAGVHVPRKEVGDA